MMHEMKLENDRVKCLPFFPLPTRFDDGNVAEELSPALLVMYNQLVGSAYKKKKENTPAGFSIIDDISVLAIRVQQIRII
jgi:hypothetical protein